MKFGLNRFLLSEILDSDFGFSSPRAQEMRVALGHAKLRAGATKAMDAHADPDAWDELVIWLRDNGTLDDASVGMDEKQRAKRMILTASKIEAKIDRLADHPGYRNLGVAGVQPVALPARRCEGEDRWWPTTRLAIVRSKRGGEVIDVVLEPHAFMSDRRLFTKWVIPQG